MLYGPPQVWEAEVVIIRDHLPHLGMELWTTVSPGRYTVVEHGFPV